MKRVLMTAPALWRPDTHRASPQGVLNLWPKCARCGDTVSAYGVGDMGSLWIEVWARCHGKYDAVKVTTVDSMTDDEKMEIIPKLQFFQSFEGYDWEEKEVA